MPADRRSDTVLMARMYNLWVFCWVFVVAGVGFSLLLWSDGAPRIVVQAHVVASAFAFCVPFGGRLRLSPGVLAVLGAATMVVLQSVTIYAEGHLSWAHAWLVTAPLIGHNAGGIRAGFWSVVLAVAALWCMTLARMGGAIPLGSQQLQSPIAIAIDLTALLIIVYVLGVVPVRQAGRAREKLADANETLRDEVRERVVAQTALRTTQGELLRTARVAGMAEVATGVLHNMGNALNTVAVTARLARDAAQDDQLERRLERTVGLLGDPMTDPETVRRYLAAVVRRVRGERMQSVAELDRLLDGIAHVAAVVSAQQQHARSGGLVEETSASALVEQAIALAKPLVERLDVSVEVSHMPNVAVVTESHQVVQILLNLVRNAADAMDDQECERRLHIHAQVDGSDLRFAVRDSGAGVHPSKRDLIFQHGFTTKPTGNGFGLHVSALAARGLGGELLLLPQAPGTGAEFSLRIPLDRRGDDDDLSSRGGDLALLPTAGQLGVNEAERIRVAG